MVQQTTFTVFDTETTGLDPNKGHKIVEIAAVKVRNNTIIEEETFVRLVNPERSIPWESKQVHNIGDEDVADAQTIVTVLPEFLEFAAGTVLVAHNAKFDMNFLQVEKECCWGFIDLPECLCTMQLSKHVFPQEFRHNLDVLTQRLGLQIPQNRHRALPDVLITAQALLTMIEQSKITDIANLKRITSIYTAT
jgi:DNA polymerase III subunit epsilon